MTIEEIEKILLNNGFAIAAFGKHDICIWNYPKIVPTLIHNRFMVYCALFFNKQNNCIENCIEIYDTFKTTFMLRNYLYVCPFKQELSLLTEEKMLKVINSQKELYIKMMKIVKQIIVDEKLNNLEKDFDNDV